VVRAPLLDVAVDADETCMDLPAKENFADQDVPLPGRGLPQGWEGDGYPDKKVGWAQNARKRGEQQRQPQPAGQNGVNSICDSDVAAKVGNVLEGGPEHVPAGHGIRAALAPSLSLRCSAGRAPRPVVDGNRGDCCLEAIGQGPG